jgi:hypothetical protein
MCNLRGSLRKLSLRVYWRLTAGAVLSWIVQSVQSVTRATESVWSMAASYACRVPTVYPTTVAPTVFAHFPRRAPFAPQISTGSVIPQSAAVPRRTETTKARCFSTASATEEKPIARWMAGWFRRRALDVQSCSLLIRRCTGGLICRPFQCAHLRRPRHPQLRPRQTCMGRQVCLHI